MEKRKKEQKIACGSSTQEPDTNDLSNKDDQNEQNVAKIGKNMKPSSPLNDDTVSENKHHTPVIQWPYTAQNAVDQYPLTSKTTLPTQTPSPSPIVISQWHFPNQHQQQNNPVQQGHIPLNYAQPIPPFWLPQRPGYPFPGMNAPATFPPLIPFGTTEVTWQAPAVGGGSASTGQPQVTNFCYPVGYSFPGVPGPCDPFTWWDQAQQSQPLYTYSFPGAYSYFSSTPSSIPTCSTSTGQAFTRGIIRPSAKLSQKHQQLWEAQSAENVQLWNAIHHLQSELADYNSRLLKLEAEVSSSKLKVEEPPAQVNVTAIADQPSKRGRPKKSVAAIDAIGSPDEPHPRARGRKPAVSKVQSEVRPHLFEKVVLNKIEEKGKASHSPATVEQRNGEDISSNATHASGNLAMPVFHNQAHLQMCGIGFAPAFEMKSNDDKSTDSKTACTILSQNATDMSTKSSSAFYIGATGNGNLGWLPANVTSEESGRNVLSMGSQGFYNNGSVIREGGKLIPGWSFVNEEDASEELEDAVLRSAKDEDDEMGEDASSGAEDVARAKVDGAYNIDGTVGTSPKGLSPLNNW